MHTKNKSVGWLAGLLLLIALPLGCGPANEVKSNGGERKAEAETEAKPSLVQPRTDGIDPIDGLDFNPKDMSETWKWMNAMKAAPWDDATIENNYFKRQDAEARCKKALQATIGKDVCWTFDVRGVSKKYVFFQAVPRINSNLQTYSFVVYLNANAKSLWKPPERNIFSKYDGPDRMFNCFELDEATLRGFSMGQKVTFTGTIESYFYQKVTADGIHNYTGFVLVNAKPEL